MKSQSRKVARSQSRDESMYPAMKSGSYKSTDNRQQTTDIVHNPINDRDTDVSGVSGVNGLKIQRFDSQRLIANSQKPTAHSKNLLIRTVFILLVSNFLTLSLAAQSLPMSLDDCMAYAVEHSTSVGKKINALDDAQQQYNSSVASLFPSLSASVSGTTNLGRSIDPETNNYTNVSTFSNSYGISGSMPLFTGLQGINTMRAAKVARERGVQELQISRDEVAMQTMQAYIDVLYYIGTTEIAAQQLEDSRLMLKEARKLYEIGRKSAADVAEVESQEANYDYLLTEQENNLALAKIRLREIMNFPQDQELELVEELDIEFLTMLTPMEEVVNHALNNNVKVVSAELNTSYSKLNYSRSKGYYYPSLYLYGGYNTSYFVNMENQAGYPSFLNQFSNNMGSYIQLGLSIPIFSGLERRSSAHMARNAWRSAELDEIAVRNAVESEVTTSYQQMKGYAKQYVVGQKKLEVAQLAYDGIAAKFEKGLVTAIDLQTASTTLLQAKSDCLRSKLQYVIEYRMVEYYNGRELINN